MTQANNSIPITPTDGTTVATHTPTGVKEYQVFIRARADGHLLDTVGTYYVSALALTRAANRNHFGIMNYPNSNILIEVENVSGWIEAVGTATGVFPGYQLFRITSMSGGTIIASADIQRKDTASPDPSSGFAAMRTNFTVFGLASEALSCLSIPEEEASSASSTKTMFFDKRWANQPILLSTGEGICVRQGAVTGAGAGPVVSFEMIFKILT